MVNSAWYSPHRRVSIHNAHRKTLPSLILSTRSLYFASVLGLVGLTSCLFGLWAFPGLEMVSLVLVAMPILAFIFREERGSDENLILLVVFALLGVVNYLYALRVGYPVGYQDVHSHIFENEILLDSSGRIDFSQAQGLSFNFVSLYVLSSMFDQVSGAGLVETALYLPPLLNLLVALFVYSLVKRSFGSKAGIITILFFGLDNNTIVFGHEFRTQILGVMFTLGALALAFIGEHLDRRRPTRIGSLIFLAALGTTSFTSIIFAAVLFLVLMAAPIIFKISAHMHSLNHYSLLIAFAFSYVLYVSASPMSVFGTMANLVHQALSPRSSSSFAVGQEIYGPLVRLFTYIYWAVGAGFCIIIFARAWKKRDSRTLLFVSCFGTVFAVGVAFSLVSQLNPGRSYLLGSILLGLVMAQGVLTVKHISVPGISRWTPIIFSVFICGFLVISMAKFPTYIGGTVEPVRGDAAIDSASYWKIGPIDQSTADFIDDHRSPSILYLEMIIRPYMIMSLSTHGFDERTASQSPPGNPRPNSIAGGAAVLLRDRLDASSYLYRDSLPRRSEYSAHQTIYDNGDYVLIVG